MADKNGSDFGADPAATASQPSLLHVSGIAGIAIAVFCLIYFGGELLRAVLP